MKIASFQPRDLAGAGEAVDVDAEDRDFAAFTARGTDVRQGARDDARETKAGVRDVRDSARGRDDDDDDDDRERDVAVSLVVHPWPRAPTEGPFPPFAHRSFDDDALRDRFGLHGAREKPDVVVTIHAGIEAFDGFDGFDDIDVTAHGSGRGKAKAKAGAHDEDVDADEAPALQHGHAGVQVVDAAAAVELAPVHAVRDVAALEAAVDGLHDPAARLNLDLNTAAILVDGLHVRLTTHGQSAHVTVEGKDAGRVLDATRELEHRLSQSGLQLESLRPAGAAVDATGQSTTQNDANRHGAGVVDVDERAEADADGGYDALALHLQARA